MRLGVYVKNQARICAFDCVNTEACLPLRKVRGECNSEAEQRVVSILNKYDRSISKICACRKFLNARDFSACSKNFFRVEKEEVRRHESDSLGIDTEFTRS